MLSYNDCCIARLAKPSRSCNILHYAMQQALHGCFAALGLRRVVSLQEHVSTALHASHWQVPRSPTSTRARRLTAFWRQLHFSHFSCKLCISQRNRLLHVALRISVIFSLSHVVVRSAVSRFRRNTHMYTRCLYFNDTV